MSGQIRYTSWLLSSKCSVGVLENTSLKAREL